MTRPCILHGLVLVVVADGGAAAAQTMTAHEPDFRHRVSLQIDQVAPGPLWEGQDLIVTYTVTNIGFLPASGTIEATLGSLRLTAVPLASLSGVAPRGTYGEQLQNLAPGQSASGAFTLHGLPAGPFQLQLSYGDQIVCQDAKSPASRKGPEPGAAQKKICSPTVHADDERDLVVNASPLILSSQDPPPASWGRADGTTCGNEGKTYPFGPPNEWQDVPGNTEVPFLGRIIETKPPFNDLVWSHPFGFDFAFAAAPDPSSMAFLNAPEIPATADCADQGKPGWLGDGDACHAFSVDKAAGITPIGELHTEIEDLLLPTAYRPKANDRVFMHGRRIVDCGHDNFTAEMHPPLFVASAHRDTPGAGDVRSKIYAMPYRTLQTYSRFGSTFMTELEDQIALSAFIPIIPIDFQANVVKVPFDSRVTAHYRVAMPSKGSVGTPTMRYSFHRRPGVELVVSPVSDYEADVALTLDPGTYVPPNDPDCPGVSRYTTADVEKQEGWPPGSLLAVIQGAGIVITPGLTANLSTFGLGVKKCTVPGPAPRAPSSSYDNAVVEDATQSTPAYGWLDWHLDVSPRRVLVARTGLGRVFASGGIDCGTACEGSYASGKLVAMTATPSAGWKFDGWSGGCAGNASICVLKAHDSLTTVNAVFSPASTAGTQQVTIDITPDSTCTQAGAGTITAPPYVICRSDGGAARCATSVPQGTSLSFQATTPLTGNSFTGFTGACSGKTCSVVVKGPTNIGATFCGLVH